MGIGLKDSFMKIFIAREDDEYRYLHSILSKHWPTYLVNDLSAASAIVCSSFKEAENQATGHPNKLVVVYIVGEDVPGPEVLPAKVVVIGIHEDFERLLHDTLAIAS